MADVTVHNNEINDTNALKNCQNEVKEQSLNNQVPEQTQDVQSPNIDKKNGVQDTSEKSKTNNQQPNQDEVQSAKSRVDQSPELKVTEQISQEENVEKSPARKTSEESSKAEAADVPALSKSSEERTVVDQQEIVKETVTSSESTEIVSKATKELVTFEDLSNLNRKLDKILSQSIISSYATHSKIIETSSKSYYEKAAAATTIVSSTNPYSKPYTVASDDNKYLTSSYLLTHTPQIHHARDISSVVVTNHINDLHSTEDARLSHHVYSLKSYATSEFQPNYDKQKLDAIISRIVGAKNVINSVKPVNTYNNEILIHNVRKEALVQARPELEQEYKKVAANSKKSKKAEASKKSCCGTIEDDAESVVMPQADESSHFHEEEALDSSQNAVQNKPRENKTPKRIELNIARKQRQGSSAVDSQVGSENPNTSEEIAAAKNLERDSEEIEATQKSNRSYLLTSPKKLSATHHREHGKQHSRGWSATIIESPTKKSFLKN